MLPRDPGEARAYRYIIEALKHMREGEHSNEDIAGVILEAFDTAQLQIIDPKAIYGIRHA